MRQSRIILVLVSFPPGSGRLLTVLILKSNNSRNFWSRILLDFTRRVVGVYKFADFYQVLIKHNEFKPDTTLIKFWMFIHISVDKVALGWRLNALINILSADWRRELSILSSHGRTCSPGICLSLSCWELWRLLANFTCLTSNVNQCVKLANSSPNIGEISSQVSKAILLRKNFYFKISLI